MPIITTNESHKHDYKTRSYAQIFMGKDGDIPKYLLLRKCDCGYKYAYDLVSENPKK